MNYWTQSENNIYVAAHRGWSDAYPENTMLAYKKALELDVDQIEIDVHATKDGQLVLIHDGKVDRTTDGTGNVRDYTLAELQKLDAGIKKGEQFKGTRIPTFEELLDHIKDHPTMTLDVELKVYPMEGDEDYAHDVCDKAIKMLEDYKYDDRCVINSWHAGLNEYVSDKYGKRIRQHVYFPDKLHVPPINKDPYDYAYCACMFGEGRYIATKEQFDWMRAKGVQPWAGAGVHDAATVDEAIACGAVLITCNNPDVILKLLRERGRHK